jgi:hypothetical protein
MKPSGWIVVFCGAALLGGLPLAAQAPSILEPKVERHEGPPLWISAKAVADEEKIIDLDLIDSFSLRGNVERQRREIEGDRPAEKSKAGEKPPVVAIPWSQCKRTQYSEDERGGTGSTATLSALAANSRSILQGTIRTIDFGFDGGVPGSLLGVETSQVVKGSSPQRLFYVLYPVARFRIGPFHFCNTIKGFEPHEGDELLLFDFTGPADRDNVLFAPRLDQIVFQNASGALFLPSQLKSTSSLKAAHSLKEVIAQLPSERLPASGEEKP